MNINECGCRPYGWLGLDGNRCIRVIPRQFNANFLFELHMVIFLDGDNVTWTSYTPIDHVQWQISNQGLHGRNLFFRYFRGIGT